MTRLVLAVATGFGIASPVAATGDDPEPYRFDAQLRDAGITPDVPGLAAFLALHVPNDALRQQYRELLAHLGDADFFRREAAMLELQRMPVHLTDELAQATQSSDAEQRWRAEAVKSHAETAHRNLLHAAFIVIRDGQLQGLAAGLLQTIPYCDNEPLQSAMICALEATATRDDAETLRSQFAAAQPWVRIAAAAAMDRAMGDEAHCDLLALLDDPDDLVRVSTAERLARNDDPDGLRALGELLDSNRPVVRHRSIQTLRKLLQVRLPYSGSDSVLVRRHNAGIWRQAIDEYLSGYDPGRNMPVHRGGADLLICTSEPGRELVELCRDGRFGFVGEFRAAVDCQSLPDGGMLVLEALHGRAVELDPAGGEVWSLPDLPATATCARRLPNGNVVVATLDGALTEYDPEHAVVRTMYLAGGVREVTLLPNERLLLVTDVPGHIIELGIDRREVWRSPRVDHLASACPAREGGFVAVCLRPEPRLVSISRAGAVEPVAVECDQPRQVRQAPWGAMFILDAQGISLMTDAGQPPRRVIDQRYLRSMAPVQF
jgi:HEAT repeat protein